MITVKLVGIAIRIANIIGNYITDLILVGWLFENFLFQVSS